jgi:PEP-CTERM motif
MKKRISGCGVTVNCGAIFCSFVILASAPFSASADQLFATSYSMLNGGLSSPGTSLMDDTYSMPGSATPYTPLAGGLGDLTDGIAAIANWDVHGPYVGWSEGIVPSPTITFSFANTVNIEEVKISMNTGYNSASVTFSTPGSAFSTLPVDGSLAGAANTWYDFTSLNLTGDSLTLTLNNRPPDTIARDWILISEVQFYGSPVDRPDHPVPEPATMLLFGAGLTGLAAARRRKKAC